VSIEQSTFDGNSAFSGGAILGGDINIDRSTFTANLANAGGGILQSGGTLPIDHSAFSQNVGIDDGAAIATSVGFSGTLTVNHSTLTDNMSPRSVVGASLLARATLGQSFTQRFQETARFKVEASTRQERSPSTIARSQPTLRALGAAFLFANRGKPHPFPFSLLVPEP